MNVETKARSASLAGALVKALSEIEGVAKDKTNPHFKSKYVDLSAVLEAVRPVFARHDLAVTQETALCENGVIVETVVLHASGDERRFGQLHVPANKQDAQGFGSALTYAKRYSLMTAFGVPAEDDDGNAAAITADEPAKRKPTVLQGSYKSITALETAIKAFAATLSRMTDMGEFSAFMGSEDVIELERSALLDRPEWWETGEGEPDIFKPMVDRIQAKQKELEQRETANVHSIIHAG